MEQKRVRRLSFTDKIASPLLEDSLPEEEDDAEGTISPDDLESGVRRRRGSPTRTSEGQNEPDTPAKRGGPRERVTKRALVVVVIVESVVIAGLAAALIWFGLH